MWRYISLSPQTQIVPVVMMGAWSSCAMNIVKRRAHSQYMFRKGDLVALDADGFIVPAQQEPPNMTCGVIGELRL